MKVLIIEDEIVAANRLKEMLFLYDSEVNIIGIIDNIVEAINFLIKNDSEVDLILMDIQLGDGLCFEIFEEIEITIPVIFTTAYDQYTLKAFKVNSIDYLLKPVETEELFNSLNKFRNIHQNVTNFHNIKSLIKTINQNATEYKYRFLIKKPTGFVPVSTNDIAYFYSEDKLTFLVTWQNKKHIFDMPLDNLITKLDPNAYFKISRGFIVHHNAIEKINYHLNNRLKLRLKPTINKDVFVSRNNVKNFKNWMNS